MTSFYDRYNAACKGAGAEDDAFVARVRECTFAEASAKDTFLGGQMFNVLADALQINRILDHAEFVGHQTDGQGGTFELWRLRKDIPGHPKDSTVARRTLEAYLFPESCKT